MFGKKRVVWDEIVSSYFKNPRDVKTVPLNREGIWFYVYAEKGDIYIENARDHLCSSKIKSRRKLDKENIDKMISFYYKRKNGERVSQQVAEITVNQVYWYGIFEDMHI